ncbi:STAS domain-containing protein [Pelosinus sp. sgz500959]|uniref:STAS domain-containing protein n=1 Tax=Pelosinus sp. sgz500959 TaxID=3242472 RepID=UPI00366C2C2A
MLNNAAVLKIQDALVIVMHGNMNDHSVKQMQHTVLAQIEQTPVSGLIIDISQLDIVDSYMVRLFSDTAQMAKLLGVEVFLVGMQPYVALSMVEMGLDIRGIKTALTVDHVFEILHNGVPYAVRRGAPQ